MTNSKLDSLREKFGASFLSKSNNSCVLDIYEIVLENLNNGFNYWEEDHGAQDMNLVFETYFTDYDFEELSKDISNWSNFQLERFTQGIVGDYCSYLSNNRTFPEHYYKNENRIKTIRYKLIYINKLIEIDKKRDLRAELIGKIDDNIDFINLHFDILLDESKSNLNFIGNIVSALNPSFDERINDKKELIEKIETAGNEK